ncbi:glycoside hydrolase [Fomitiporia mediterranea MF3/22]|uniref:glycoside hydrolase n=1 Tax=Fomitiporia mediterranea (strain MF3/22) TaxID=694068 RepID=UPI0004408B52|nr:glycoside hydrolase [Fomitiporia mediterranea MF3/22]EJD02700.1 glycoside hydrolase [Fomitiporia mediterranea MF3/22]
MLFLQYFLTVLCLSLVSLAQKYSLSDLQWTLKNSNGSISVPAQVPSQAHLDLLRAGIITEPLLGANDFTQRWVANENWTYTADLSPFTATLEGGSTEKTLLVFYGIDTVANIVIPQTMLGQPVAWVNNQFRQYVYDVSAILAGNSSSGDDNLTVAFEAASTYGLNVSSRPDVEWDLEGISVFEYPGGHPWVRKTASDFGWDWGPAFVPSGIFKPAYFIALGDSNSTTTSSSVSSVTFGPFVFVEEKSIEISKVGQKPSLRPNETADWLVNVTLGLRSSQAFDNLSMIISFPELNVTSEALPLASIPGDTSQSTFVSANMTVLDGVPERWYPHNLGTPQRYNITVSLIPANVTFTTTTGFRTIVLVQDPYPQSDVETRGITPGDQFHFEVNGKAFYSLGTNIIPFDPFYSRMTTAQVRWVVESAVLSGQNMLRVWGGGIYQPSDEETGVYNFYETCDELGILAWSELIFSDNLYPINDFLLESIAPEVRQNVRRTNRHPSNAQWAGGNEIEGIVEVVNTTLANGTHYLDEFVELFQDFLHDIVLNETSSLSYTDCSTTSGYLSLDPYVLRFRNGTPGEIYGNSERYNYDASQAFNYSTYPVSRYVNEFGFHSMPSFYSWEEVLESPDDFSFNSTIVFSRDHHPPAGGLTWPNPNANQGQAQMTEAVELWLPTPGTNDSNQTFAQWCWSTQIFQSLNMISEIAWYRRGAGLGENNLGALVWQLNDIWQGVSWSSIEYSGRWKVLQYALGGAFAPVTIYPFWTPENQTLEVLVTSDRWETVNGTAQLTWFNWAGNVLNSSSHNFTTPTLNNSVIFSATGLENILPTGANASDAWMLLNVTAETESGQVTNEQYFTPTPLANASLIDPQINVTRGPNLTFTLSAQGGVAPFTWLDHPSGTVGIFVDSTTGKPSNGFYLVPGNDRTVQFVLNDGLSKVSDPDPADFVVRSLWNNTHA